MPSKTSTKPKVEVILNTFIQNEISRLAEIHFLDAKALENFALFVIENHKKKETKVKVPKAKSPHTAKFKPLPATQIKDAVLNHFGVKNLTELRKSGSFQMATSGIDILDLKSGGTGWKTLYRKLIGILPEEENETGHGCINGINIFKYDMPWKAFGLDPKTSTTEDVKLAYRNLSKIYHPDNPETGNASIFERLTIFYKSLTEKF